MNPGDRGSRTRALGKKAMQAKRQADRRRPRGRWINALAWVKVWRKRIADREPPAPHGQRGGRGRRRHLVSRRWAAAQGGDCRELRIDRGGVFADGGSSPFLDGGVVHGNSADGGRMRLSEGGVVGVVNSFASGNQAALGGGVHLDGEGLATPFSNLWGNVADGVVGADDPTGTAGSIGADPAFVATASEAWDPHLDLGSPLIDAGAASADAPDSSPTDIGASGGAGGGGGRRGRLPEWWHPGSWDPATGWDCDDLDPHRHPGQGC